VGRSGSSPYPQPLVVRDRVFDAARFNAFWTRESQLVSADALFRSAAKLPRVEIARPPSAVGRNTVNSMQSGLVFGYAGLVDAIVGRIKAEVDFTPRVVGTGGLAPLIASEARSIDECDDMLTLRGLAIIHDRNR